MKIKKLIITTAALALSVTSLTANSAAPIGVGVPFGLQGIVYDRETYGGTTHIFRPTIYDQGSKRIYTRKSTTNAWKLSSVGGGYYNIRSVSRPAGCIYDSSGSKLAKFDSSCNSNYSRAEWRFEAASHGYYKIINKKGRCLETDNKYNRLRAVTCTSSAAQQFVVYN